MALARTQTGLEELDDEIRKLGGEATLVPLDLRNGKGIAQLAEILDKRFGQLDALVLNAGQLGELTPIAQGEPAMWEEVMATNLGGPLSCIQHFEPLLRKAASAHVVALTSGAARGLRPFWGAYATSKAALEALIKIWAAELAPTKIKVNLFDPGVVATKMRAKAAPGEDQNQLPQPVRIGGLIAQLCTEKITQSGALFTAAQMLSTAKE